MTPSKPPSIVLRRNSSHATSVRRAHVPNPTVTQREALAALGSPLPVESAERQIETMLGFSAVLFASARGALTAAIATLASSEEVAIPAYTCAAVANAVISAGHVPLYVDVDEGGLVRSESWPEGRLALVQDTYGFRAPTPPNHLVIRDSAHRLILDTVADSSVTVTSFEHSKWISAGQGGLALTTDPDLAVELRRLRDQAGRQTSRLRHVFFTLLTLTTGRLEYRGRPRSADPFGRIAYRVDTDRLRGQSELELRGSGVDPQLLGRPNSSVASLMVSQLRQVDRIGTHRSGIVALYDRAAGFERSVDPLVRYPMLVSEPDVFEGRLLEQAGTFVAGGTRRHSIQAGRISSASAIAWVPRR